jgi:hypothetical protein
LVHTQHRHDEADDPVRFAEHSFRESEQAFRQIEQPFRNTSVLVRLQPKRVFIFQRKPCSTSTEVSVRLRRNTQFANEMDELRARLMYASRLFGSPVFSFHEVTSRVNPAT